MSDAAIVVRNLIFLSINHGSSSKISKQTEASVTLCAKKFLALAATVALKWKWSLTAPKTFYPAESKTAFLSTDNLRWAVDSENMATSNEKPSYVAKVR